MNESDTSTTEALLATYRRTLAHLLNQAAAQGGEVFAPPGAAAGIASARVEIMRLKEALRAAGVVVEDEVNDTRGPEPELQSPTTQPRPSVSITISGGTVSGPVVGSNSGTITTSTQPSTPPAQEMTLAKLLGGVRTALSAAERSGDEDLAADLRGAVLTLEAAEKAQREGKLNRAAQKLRDASEELARLTSAHPSLVRLAHEAAAFTL